ncbi:IF-2B-domain-containing protein [Violaceomyces palustris]|uniref:IF-2B-domain-containing protein n=1 Tax=Violaceomyces palustris TaxID=1673888 RepID=A0ACD0P6I5_9BASI|nr:IF-2B-domain-containing protein [Violaceomyces palustris]
MNESSSTKGKGPAKEKASKSQGASSGTGSAKPPKDPGQKSAKELKKERRAAMVAERGGGQIPPHLKGQQPQQQIQKGGRGEEDGSSNPSKGKEDGQSRRHGGSQQQGGGGGGSGSNQRQQHQQQQQLNNANTATTSDLTTPSVLGGVSLFGNVSQPKSSFSHAQSVTTAIYRSSIHPSILRLGSQLAGYKVMGADARAIALLQALADVIRDYKTPRGEALNRDLLKTVSNQVGHLVEARAMGTSTGVAVRYLKYEISVCDAEATEEEAKAHLLERIDHFIRDRIVYAGKIIRAQAGSKIRDGDVVMTFARSSVVEATLLAAHAQGTRFSVIVVDSRPLLEGKALLSVLLSAGIPCTYGLLSSLGSLIPRASLLLLGTASLFANGALYSRAGTASCAMMAKDKGIPVIVCCETYKFSDRVQLDSFVQNEAGNPTELLSLEHHQQGLESRSGGGGVLTVSEWNSNPNLGVVNLLYDVTPPRYVTAVASEVGLSGPESVGVILRDYKSVLYGV